MKLQARSLTVVFYALFSDILFYGLIIPLLPDLGEIYGISPFQTQLFFGIYAGVLVLLSPLIGVISDRIGRKVPMIAGSVALIAATILFLLTRKVILILVARVLQGAATAVNWTVGLALINDVHEDREKGRAMGICMAGMSLGIIIGPIMGGALYRLAGLRAPFMVVLGLNIIDLVLRSILLQDPPAVSRPLGKVLLKKSGILRSLLSLMGLTVLAVSLMSFLEPVLPFRLQGLHDLDSLGIAWILLVMSLVNFLFYPLAGAMADKLNKNALILAGFLGALLAYLLLAQVRNLAAITILVSVIGMALSVLLATLLPYFSQRLGAYSLPSGMIYGLFNLAYSIGMFFGPLCVAGLASRLPFAGMVRAFTSGIFLISLVLFLILRKGRKPQG